MFKTFVFLSFVLPKAGYSFVSNLGFRASNFNNMWSNTKLLVISCLFVIISGFGLLWYGLNPKTSPTTSPSPTPLVDTVTVVTSSAEIGGTEGQRVLVIKVIDGDTIEIDNGTKVRLLGIDTPETKDPRRPVQCFGKQAATETKNLLEGKFVILEKDISETDKYGRYLRYIFLPLEDNELLFINDYLIREGFAKVLTYPPDVKYTEQFLEAQRKAKDEKRGLWGRC